MIWTLFPHEKRGCKEFRELPKRTKNNLKSSKTRLEESKERGKKPMQYDAM